MWHLIQTCLHITAPQEYILYPGPASVWRNDSGLYRFRLSSGGYCISGDFLPSLRINSTIYAPLLTPVNGVSQWRATVSGAAYGTTYGVWCTMSGKWVWGTHPGFEPEYANVSNYVGVYSGDLPVAGTPRSWRKWDPSTNAYYADTLTVEYIWPRWTSSAEYGVYQAVDQTADPVTFGCPRWRSNTGAYYVRTPDASGYSDMSRSGSLWIIGELNNPSGWYQGPKPSLTESTVYAFTLPAGSTAAAKPDLTLTFCDYVLGTGQENIWLAESAILR